LSGNYDSPHLESVRLVGFVVFHKPDSPLNASGQIDPQKLLALLCKLEHVNVPDTGFDVGSKV
jgi:hypothetical protein